MIQQQRHYKIRNRGNQMVEDNTWKLLRFRRNSKQRE